MLRLLGKTLLALAVVFAAVALAAGGYRAWRQHEAERGLAISAPNGIDEGLFVGAPSGEQWVTFRAVDRNNPVLLIVHGGPGAALSPLATAFLPYEQQWTVVQWDQAGAGRTFARAGDTLPATTTVATVAADGIAVTEHIRERLGKERVVLLGLSWGSVIGLEMARARPDLFDAYVGTGLFVHRDDGRRAAYERVLARARGRNQLEAVAALTAVGAPPYTQPDGLRTLNRWIEALTDEEPPANRVIDVLVAPRQSLGDVASYVAAYVASDEHFDLGAHDLRKGGVSFGLPIVIIHGAEDYDTPIDLVRSYFESVTAPRKQFVTLAKGGHTALIDDRANFLAALNEHVLPLVR
jgi:pimeloyl-ACP methyl ester carboxylesterase